MDNNKIVLCHLYKDFTKSDFIIFLIESIFLLLFSIFLSVYFKVLGVYIASLVLIIASLTIMITDIYAYKKSKNLDEEVIIYDEAAKQFIINFYRKKIFLNLTDIKTVRYKNKFLEVLEPIILFVTKNEGHIIFLLNDGQKIKTHKIKEVVQIYSQIKEIVEKASMIIY